MKKVGLVISLIFLFILLTFTWSFAQMEMGKGCKHEAKAMGEEMMPKEKCGQHQEGMTSHMSCCKMGSGIMGMRMCGMMEGEEEMSGCKAEFFLCCKKDLGLTDKQVEALKGIKMGSIKNEIKMGSDLKIAQLEFKSLMEDEKATLKDIEAKLRAVEKLKVDMKLSHIKAFREAKVLLTPEQKEKMMKCYQGM